MSKTFLGKDVLQAARGRISLSLQAADRAYVSFSGGKDSTVMLDLVARVARAQGKRIGVLFVDLEAQYQLTISHVETCFELYADVIDPYWVCAPLNLRNAVSQYEPFWTCWDPSVKKSWVRPMPNSAFQETFPFFRFGMEFEEFVPEFAEWYAGGESTVCFVGIRTQESLNRWRTIASRVKTRVNDWPWSTQITEHTWNCYPIYDWQTEDVWTYHTHPDVPVNGIYDLMYRAGLTIHQSRICQPYGDDQRKGLWLFQVLEPHTWARVVARVNGANQGALYAQESGNMLGRLKVTRPAGHTWQSFARMIIDSMPVTTSSHYREKIDTFLQWWALHGYPNGIPDEADRKLEAAKKAPSWRRICKVLLRNDYWCKGLSFAPTKSVAATFARYNVIMRDRSEWERQAEIGKTHPACGLLTAEQMNVPSAEQLALVASLVEGNHPKHAYRAIETITGTKRHQQTAQHAAQAIDHLKSLTPHQRNEEHGHA